MNQQKTTVVRSFRGGPQAHDQLHHAVVMQMQASGRIFQERADNSLQPWGLRAPHPVIGEDNRCLPAHASDPGQAPTT